jgi:hypothetical protein
MFPDKKWITNLDTNSNKFHLQMVV